MEPMFLPEVEHNLKPGPYGDMLKALQASGAKEYSQIWHLFAFLPKATEHLNDCPF